MLYKHAVKFISGQLDGIVGGTLTEITIARSVFVRESVSRDDCLGILQVGSYRLAVLRFQNRLHGERARKG